VIPSQVARRYARAVLEIGIETGTLDALVNEMSRAAEAYAGSAELRAALENPLISVLAKRAILVEISDRLGLGPTARNTLQLLSDRRRMRALPGIAQRLHEFSDQRRGVVRAEVTTAAPLGNSYYAQLQTQLEKLTGKQVVIDRREDPGLIGGVVTRIGDTVYDGSLRTRLHELKHALLPS
jgi:F-type H+-transporting ATPase subunit delta